MSSLSLKDIFVGILKPNHHYDHGHILHGYSKAVMTIKNKSDTCKLQALFYGDKSRVLR